MFKFSKIIFNGFTNQKSLMAIKGNGSYINATNSTEQGCS